MNEGEENSIKRSVLRKRQLEAVTERVRAPRSSYRAFRISVLDPKNAGPADKPNENRFLEISQCYYIVNNVMIYNFVHEINDEYVLYNIYMI